MKKQLTFIVLALIVIAAVGVPIYMNHAKSAQLDFYIAKAENSPAKKLTYVEYLDRVHQLKDTPMDDWTRAVAVMALVRSTATDSQFTGPGVNETHDMQYLYNQITAENHPVLCNDMATLEEWTYSIIGIRSVRWQNQTEDGTGTHVTVDVWLNDQQKWVTLDPTFSNYWVKKGTTTPIDVPAVHDLLLSEGMDQIEAVDIGNWVLPSTLVFKPDVRLEYHTIYRTNPILP